MDGPTVTPAQARLPFLWRPPAPGASPVVYGRADGGDQKCAPEIAPELRPRAGLPDPQAFKAVFSAWECEEIIALGSASPLWEGRSTASARDYRVCRTSFIEEQACRSWIFERLSQAALDANQTWQFALSGFGEPLHFVRYEAGGHFDWHTDLAPGRASTRKLSLSVQLSLPGQYEGGTLELSPHGPLAGFREQGSVLVFPSYVPHKVGRIESGRRDALVAWVHGPAFR